MAEQTMRKHLKERFGNKNNFSEVPPLPSSLNIELNNNCNQKCVFCPYHGEHAPIIPNPTVMPYEKAVEVLDAAKKIGIGEKEVGFYFSGEVFLHKDLGRIVKHAKDIGYQYTFITTNGSLASKERMKEVLDAGLDSIRFSINAADRESYKEIHGKDDFDKVLENIKFMHEYIQENSLKVATSISCVLTKKTANMQEEIRKQFGEYVDDILFIPVMLNRLNCDKAFIEQYQMIDDSKAQINPDFICPILFNTMYINANLEVVPCCDSYHDDCTFYDLKEKLDLEEAWMSEKFRRYRNIFLIGADDKGTICENCMLRMKGVDRLEI